MYVLEYQSGDSPWSGIALINHALNRYQRARDLLRLKHPGTLSGTPPSGQWGGVSDGSAGRGPGAMHQGEGGGRGGRGNPDAKVNLDEYNLFS